MTRNRDYFSKPIQGNGRSSWDYGNTHLGTDRKSQVEWWEAGIAAFALILGVLAFFGGAA